MRNARSRRTVRGLRQDEQIWRFRGNDGRFRAQNRSQLPLPEGRDGGLMRKENGAGIAADPTLAVAWHWSEDR